MSDDRSSSNRNFSSRAKEICLEALEMDPAERKTYLQRVFSQDSDLRREIDSLLNDSKVADYAIETPGAAPSTDFEGALTLLQETKSLLHAMLAAVPDHVCVLNGDGIITKVNKAWLRFGHENDVKSTDLISPGRDYLAVTRKGVEQGEIASRQALDGLQAVLEKRLQSFTLEYPCHSPSKDRWFSMMVVPLDSKFGGVLITHRDITQRRQYQEILQKSEHSSAEVQKIARLGDWRWDIGADHTHWSAELFKILGLDSERISPSKTAFLERVHPEDRPRLEECIAKLLTRQEPFSVDHRILLSDGSIKFLHSVARLERDAEGQPVSLHGIAQDISERKEVEEQLRIRDQAIESSINGIGITDLEGRLIYVNEACILMWGFQSRDEVIGRYLPEFWEGEGFLEAVQALHEKGGHVGEDIGKKKDGSVFPVQFSAYMIQDETGHPLYMLGSFIDITEKKLAEEKLRRREQSLAGAQRIAHVGDWDWDTVIDKTVWSDEVFRILGLRPLQTEPSYATFLERVHPDDQDMVKKALDQALEDPVSGLKLQHRIKRQDGTVRVVQESGEIIVNEEGKPIRLVGTMHDITELKAIEAESRHLLDQLAHHDRIATMGTLTAAIAHETNQPLTAIQSSAQAGLRFLDADQIDLDEVRESLNDIVVNNKRAGDLIQKLRAMAQKERFHREPLYLNDLVAEVLHLIDSEIVARNVSVALTLDSALPIVYGDPVQTQQVILNLLINALEAMEKQPKGAGRLFISTRFAQDNGVLVSIVDSGPGIETEELDEIFEPFHTAKATGMGLGLSVSRSIVEAHGGRLWAESNPQGGANFSFYLPSGRDEHQ